MAKGIDVSQWQGYNLDFNKLKADGIQFVMIRAGYGKYSSQKDPCFETNYKKAKAAGLMVGAYWYSYAKSVSDAEQEAKVFLQTIAGKKFEYPIAFDIEDSSQLSLSNSTISAIVEKFCSYCEAKGYYVMLYSYENFLQTRVNESTRRKYDLWVANITRKPTLPYGIWQYSFTGRPRGSTGDTDMNTSEKAYQNIMAFGGFNGFPKKSTSSTNAVKNTAKTNASNTATSKPSSSSSVRFTTYTVKPGDTLWAISRKYNTSIVQIAKDNNIQNVNLIYAGQKLKIRV